MESAAAVHQSAEFRRWKESSMRVIHKLVLVLCGMLGLFGGAAVAQQAPPAHATQIHAALNSTNELMADLKFLCELAGPQGVKGWKLLEPFLEETFAGTDPARPAVVDVLFNANGSDIRAHFPLLVDPKKPLGTKFLTNLAGIGIPNKRLTTGFYQLGGGAAPMKGAAFDGYLRLLNPPITYASISKDKNLVPANLTDPTKGAVVAALLAKKYDVGVMMKNPKQAEADQKARRADFQKAKENLLAGLKKKPDETPEAFAVQKALLEHNLGELERFIAESDELTLGWITDAPKKEARLDLELAAIPGSALDASAKLLGQKPGMFAGVPRSPDAILSGRLHFPLDEFRQSSLVSSLPLYRAAADVDIAASTNKSAEQKEAMKLASKLFFDMVDAEVKVGVIDGLIEMSQGDGEKSNLVFGIKAKDGHALKGILELIPKMNAYYKVQLDVEKVGEISLHSIQIPENHEDFEMIFGKGAPVFIATGSDAWWVAVGAKSKDQLKAALGAVGQGNAAQASNFLTLFGRLGPWVEFIDTRRTRLDAVPSDVKLTEADLKDRKDRAAIRKIALDTLKGSKGTFETKLDVKDGKVTGSTRFDEGVLHFIGSAIADFSNKTLK
jgi:hypothetical protein